MDSGEAVRRHIAHMVRRGLRPNTIALRKRVLRRLELHAGKSLLRVDLDDLRAYLDRLSDPGSRAAERTQLCGFYRWAALEGYIKDDPTFRLESIRKRKYLPRPIPDELLARALADPPPRILPALWLAAYAGLRAHDLAQLRGEHLMFNRPVPIVFIEDSKGGKTRSVPLAPLLVARLLGRVPESGWVFPYLDGTPGHVPAHYISKLCNDYLHGLGIPHTLHQARHFFVTKCYAVDRDLVVTQELAGHESISTTRLYTWVDPAAAAATVNALTSPFPPLAAVAELA